jgi:hypothetical protein
VPNTNSILAFALDKQERVWIGTGEELVLLDTKGNWFTYTPANSGLPGFATALAIDENERLWIGTTKGLSVIDLRKGLPKTVPDDWLTLQAKILFPIKAISTIVDVVFFPVNSCYGPFYIALLILIVLSVVGLFRSENYDSAKLFYSSATVFILATIGAIILYFFFDFVFCLWRLGRNYCLLTIKSVRMVSGYCKPSQANQLAFDVAVDEIASATSERPIFAGGGRYR